MGRHYLLNLYGCPFELLDDEPFIVKLLTDVALLCEATILNTVSHKFEPQGVTSILLLAESHISIHTWPQDGKAAADIYTCSSVDPEIGCRFMIDILGANGYKLQYVPR